MNEQKAAVAALEPGPGPRAVAGQSLGPFDVVASITVLFALALAQPLLQVLGQSAEFFVFRDSPTSDIILLALMLTVVVPLVLTVLTIAAGRINATAGDIIHSLLFVFLTSVIVLYVARRTALSNLAGAAQLVLALAAALALLVLYRRSEKLRRVFRWSLPLPIVIFALFMFASPTSALILEARESAVGSVDVANPAPVVFVLFDGLPVSDLMDQDGGLQEAVYPNFARLAEDGTWFRNAITVHYRTETSVPAIVTGVISAPGELPIEQDHPNNLFTLLEDDYEIRAEEPVTRLCPERLCARGGPDPGPVLERWRSLASDARILAGHLILPVDLTAGLPPIDETWGGFDLTGQNRSESLSSEDTGNFSLEDEFRSAAIDHDRREPIDRFVEALQTTGSRPTFSFLHAIVPHGPFFLLPSGQLHDLPRGRHPSRTVPGYWVDDAWMMDQMYQLHLMQVEYADTIIGRVIDALEASGRYDESLIVVVSDHGESFRPGAPRGRPVEVLDDILPIPLFIKAPYQRGGGIDDYRALTVDIVPTMADILGIEMPWAMDGTSLLEHDRPERNQNEVESREGWVTVDLDGTEAIERAEHRIGRFGTGGAFGLAPEGHADLLGRKLNSLPRSTASGGSIILREAGRLSNVDPQGDVLPVSVRGRIDGIGGREAVIAFSLNGEIVAVTRTYVNSNDTNVFDAMLPPASLQAGRNEFQLLEVMGTGSSRTFHPID